MKRNFMLPDAFTRAFLQFGIAMKALSVACCGIALGAAPAWAAQEQRDKLEIFVSDRVISDDNLYRQPSGMIDVVDANGARLRGEDYINRISVGVDGRWPIARQLFKLAVQIDDNRFSHNDQLNNFSGAGTLGWDWQAGSNLSGTLGADYSRALVDFANNRIVTKDLVDLSSYFGEMRYGLGSRWSVAANVRYGETSHSIDIRKVDDFQSKSGGFGVRYATPAGASLAADYRYVDARFPQDSLLNGVPFDRSYNENTTSMRVKYPFTAKLQLDATGGYLRRAYATEQNENFSGDIWRASLQWEPTIKTQIAFNAWRQLQAYIDAESNYFISKGGSIAPTWSPREKLSFVMELSLEDQTYLTSTLDPFFTAGRRDKVKAGQIRAIYQPRRHWRIDLSYRHENRDSNRALLEYRDNLASLGARFTF